MILYRACESIEDTHQDLEHVNFWGFAASNLPEGFAVLDIDWDQIEHDNDYSDEYFKKLKQFAGMLVINHGDIGWDIE